MKIRQALSGVLMVVAAMAPAASPAAVNEISPQCASIDGLLRQARTEFPALKRKKFEAATCVYRKQEFRCDWAFPSDTFAAAETQASRLARCVAVVSGAQPLAAKSGEARFQLNPETSVLIRGPMLDSGSWKLRLQVVTPADWN